MVKKKPKDTKDCLLKSCEYTAGRLGVTPKTLRKMAKYGRISYRPQGNEYRFTEEDINDYIKSIRTLNIGTNKEEKQHV
jgi:excisionase family DNA binding protein